MSQRKSSKPPVTHVLRVDGVPMRSGRPSEIAALARDLKKIHRGKDYEIIVTVRDWSAPGGNRLVRDYSNKRSRRG